MGLTPGTRVASYEIVALLGSGGMGEVYRARDHRLDRDVAIKVLPENLSRDPAALARFEREARSASALNHPHIVQVYEIGTAMLDGVGETVRFVSMEYVEGQSLRQTIGNGSDLRRNLEVLAAVGDALARAHAAGIVHRDIKPENIMVTRDGYAKIIDFGLAKLAEPPKPIDPAGDQVTARRLTTAGLILGTVGYISPEQVQGRDADHRSDIFSLGCVLFEAVTGTAPFQKDSLIDTLHAIVYEPVQSLSSSIPTIPGELQWIVRKCLAKDPGERYQSASEVSIDLREVKRQIDSGARSGTHPIAFAAQNRSRTKFFAALVAGLLAIAAVAFLIIRAKQREATTAVASTPPEMSIRRITQTGNAVAAAISPDGRYVAYAIDEEGMQSLWLRQLATSADIQVVKPAQVSFNSLSFSGDGNYLRYFVATLDEGVSLHEIPILGGASRKVTTLEIPAPQNFIRIAVSSDGRHIVFPKGEEVVLRDVTKGQDRVILSNKRIQAISWSEDGRSIVAGGGAAGQWHSDVFVVDPFSGVRTPIVTPHWRAFAQTDLRADGNLLVIAHLKTGSARGQLWEIPPAPAPPRRITNDLASYQSFSISADDRTIVAVQEENDYDITVHPANDLSDRQRVTRGAGGVVRMSWALNDRVLYDSTLDESMDIWMVDMAGRQQKIVADDRSNYTPSVSPDGRFMVFGSNRGSGSRIWKSDLDGRNAKPLTAGPSDYLPEILADGRTVTFWHIGNNGTRRTTVEGNAPTVITTTPSQGCFGSSDGSKLLCGSWKLGSEVAVIRTSDGAPERVLRLPDNEDGFAAWAPGNQAVDYIASTKGVDNLWRQPIDGSPPRQLTHFTSGKIDNYKWSADGSKLAINHGNTRRNVVLITR